MSSKNVVLGAAILGFVAFAGPAMAQATSTGTLAVTGTIVSSISLTIESAGGTTSGLGTGAASTALGNVSKFGAAPTNFTVTKGVSDWTLASNVGVKVVQANGASATYTLRAQLASAPLAGVAWKINDLAVLDSALTDITATGTYGATPVYAWDIVIADTAAAGALNNTINFAATSN